MSAATASVGLDTEASAQRVGTYRLTQQVEAHGGHNCCQDRTQARTQAGVWLGRPTGRTLIGERVTTRPDVDMWGPTGEGEWETRRAVAVPLRCRMNRCPCCGPRLRRRRRARAFQGAHGKVVMVTYTIDRTTPAYAFALASHPSMLGGRKVRAPRAELGALGWTAEISSRYAGWAWNRLRLELGRAVIERDGRRVVQRYGPRPYFRGLELQRDGTAHLHVLYRVRDVADFAQLRRLIRGNEARRTDPDATPEDQGLAIRAGFGRVVDVQLARSGGDVARYVSKGTGVSEAGGQAVAYVSKGAGQAIPKHARQASWSVAPAAAWAPGWVKPTPVAGFTWRVADAHSSVVVRALEASGVVIEDLERFRVPSAPDGAGGTSWLSG